MPVPDPVTLIVDAAVQVIVNAAVRVNGTTTCLDRVRVGAGAWVRAATLERVAVGRLVRLGAAWVGSLVWVGAGVLVPVRVDVGVRAGVGVDVGVGRTVAVAVAVTVMMGRGVAVAGTGASWPGQVAAPAAARATSATAAPTIAVPLRRR
ncbi:hypothetical protein [Acidipropionibacterium timonense]|uniref:hypothetical protein n=1 Tax=Acidipropionibacterium timonense TaxID=2161818 RepID=UPI0010318EB3|nr:hypothetical protein [Acidipropionibacterium timonense]